MLSKKGQLGLIELKYWFIGFIIGILGGLILVMLGNKGVIPFKIPVVCGAAIFAKDFNKKAQLGMIEFQYFLIGFLMGLVLSLVLVYLGTAGILPFSIPLVCS